MAEKLAHDLEWIADRSVRLYLRTVFVTRRPRAPSRRSSQRRLDWLGHVRDLRNRVRPRRRSTPSGCARCRRRSFHRGPDSEGTHLDGPVGIAARRLAIIDLTGGDQPIANEDGSVVVVQNGEIYNYRELMRELERAGHRFRDALATPRCSCTATSSGGRELWARLRGMFAVAVWDARAAAARARARPLRDQAALLPRRRRRAVVRVGARRAAAGRDRPRRARGVPRLQLDPGAALDLPRDPQAAAGSHAHLATRGASRSSGTRGPGPLPARHDEDEAELVEECRARLRDSVRAHLVADVPVGVLLSGGVDSGALAALAAEESSGGGAHVLDRLRGGVVRRARRRARGRAALRDACTASSSCAPTRRCSCRRSPTRSTSRSPTRRRCRPTSSRSSRPRT